MGEQFPHAIEVAVVITLVTQEDESRDLLQGVAHRPPFYFRGLGQCHTSL
jgi:hypothetical protein